MASPAIAQNYHPLYGFFQDVWRLCKDCYEGEDVVKFRRELYLPPTGGQLIDGAGKIDTLGENNYRAYVKRAHFPDVFADAVEDLLGLMYRDEPLFELPPKLEALLSRASYMGETLPMIMKRASLYQLITGRLAVLGDIMIDKDGLPQPVLTLYEGDKVVNWDDVMVEQASSALRFVVLDESDNELTDDYTWKYQWRYRVIGLAGQDNRIVPYVDENGNRRLAPGTVGFDVLEDTNALAEAVLKPMNLQGQTLESVPMVFINSKDLSSVPSRPPLLGLAHLNMTIYRGEADYRQALHMTGQDTLVKIGTGYGSDDGETVRVGAGAMIEVPIGGDAKFIGINSQGIPEQRQALQRDYERAKEKASKLFSSASSRESGEALKIRMASQTASPAQMLQTVAAGFEAVLKTLAVWFGEDPEKVSIRVNTDFSGAAFEAQNMLFIAQAKMAGAPISDESIHEWLVSQGMTTKTYEEEQSAIESEAPKLAAGLGVQPGTGQPQAKTGTTQPSPDTQQPKPGTSNPPGNKDANQTTGFNK